MQNRLLLLPLVVFAAALPLQAQLVFTSPGTQVIDFQSDVGWSGSGDPPGDNVFRHTASGEGIQHRPLIERNNWEWSGSNERRGFSADAWSWSRSAQDIIGGGNTGVRTHFEDFNNDGDLADVVTTVNSIALNLTHATFGVGAESADDYLIRFASNNNTSGVTGPFADFSLTLRVLNNTGSAISDWGFALDVWHGSSDNSFHNLSLRWSTDNVNFTDITTFTTTNTGGVYTAQSFNQTFTASVADGAYLYLQLDYARPIVVSYSGSALLFDNWAVTAVPEPATFVLLAGVLALGGVLWRRRRLG